MKGIISIFCLLFLTSVQAQDLVYTPKNPAFGGDTFNYQWMLSGADAQNDFQEENEDFGFERESDIERFSSNLNSQLLNNVSRQLYNDRFGEGQLQPGNYTFGSLSVEVAPSSQGLAISILDTNTGESTSLIIPYF